MAEGNLEYLSKVFAGLSVEKKDYVLNTARSLMAIQDGNIYTCQIKPELPKYGRNLEKEAKTGG